MKIKILDYDEDNEITLEVDGEGHTFANVLREFLSDVKDVDSAGYYKEHPFNETSRIKIKAAPKKKIDKAFRTACKDLTKTADDFYKLLEKAV
ncbi:MAG TPA: RpoL/Rpb11 RNA polymerase subunit family protein [Candidatus Bathyarchaeia archaeon]|nr:RpoL/Rpb11 RNA polymerase subunit family protein [Candidatus Bathyarchaeia archaeon]